MAKKTQVFNYQDETKVHPALIKYCGYCMKKATIRLRSLMDDELKKFNVSTGELGLLKVIQDGEKISQIQLGDQLGIDKASMVKLIDALEKQKLVERIAHPTDRRVKNIQLTKNGQKILDHCQSGKLRAEKKFFEPLTTAEEKTFRDLIQKLIPSPTITASIKK